MTSQAVKGTNGYDIPYTGNLIGHEKKVIIIAHGFGSSKESPTAKMLMKALPSQDTGVIAFDFPSHGDSPAPGEGLRIPNCISDLKRIEDMAADKCPGCEIYYFASSFGAYITLLYLSSYPHRGTKAFLRSAAVNMPERFEDPTPKEAADLAAQGYTMVDRDYDKPLKITTDFIEDLQKHNLFKLYKPSHTKLKMIHGDNDEVIEFAKAKSFSEQFNIDLTVVPKGDHRLSIPGAEEQVLKLAAAFFEE